MQNHIKKAFIDYLSKKNSIAVESNKTNLIRFSKAYLGFFTFCLVTSGAYRFFYYWEYEVNILNPKISRYSANRQGLEVSEVRRKLEEK